MATIAEFLERAFAIWYKAGLEHTKGVIKEHWLVGPRPQRLAVKTSNLRNRIDGKVLPDGFAIGTKVEYGKYWESDAGIKAHKIVAKKAKALTIFVPVAKGARTKTLKRAGIIRAGKLKGIIFRKSANIPAQAPRKWLRPGVDEAMPEVIAMGNSVMLDALKAGFPDKTVGP